MIEASEYVVMKLTSGEQVLAAVLAEFDESVVIAFPLLLKSIPAMREGVIYERIATAEFCSYTDDKEFNILRKDIVYMKPMKKAVALMYQRSLQEMYLMTNESSLQIDPTEKQEEASSESNDTQDNTEEPKVYH